MDMVGGVPWKASTSVDSEEGIMPAVDIGMEMPEVDIPRVPKEDTIRAEINSNYFGGFWN